MTATAMRISALSAWIDNHPDNAARDPEARLWGRVAKVGEEGGEVIAALIGLTGQNPRKGVTHTRSDLRKELLDVAVTALAAIEHLDGNDGLCMDKLDDHVRQVWNRAELNGIPY